MTREYPRLPPVAGQWHHHAFSPHVDRPNSCVVCGRKRGWRHHLVEAALARAGVGR